MVGMVHKLSYASLEPFFQTVQKFTYNNYSQSLGGSQPTWKQGYGQFCFLSHLHIVRKKLKSMGTSPDTKDHQVYLYLGKKYDNKVIELKD